MSDIEDEVKCSECPNASHGFDRNASHNAGRYVCQCESHKCTAESLRQQLAEKDAEIARRITLDELDREIDSASKAVADFYENKLAEKDAEIERLNSKLRNLALDCIAADGQAFDSWQQLAASQAREQQLRDEKDELSMLLKAQRSEWHKVYEIAMLAQHRASALTTALNRVLGSVIPYREDGEPSIPDSVIAVVNSALSLPQDTTALEALITKAGEVMRERCRKVAFDMAYADSMAVDVSQAIRAIPAVILYGLK